MVSRASFESLERLWADSSMGLHWPCLSVVPAWLMAWWRSFGREETPFLCSVSCGGELLGLAPLMRHDKRVGFMGDGNVCDFFDFILAPGREDEFFEGFLDHLGREGIALVHLEPVRSDSAVMTKLVPMARERGCRVLVEPHGVSLERVLPATWEDFLMSLSGKERHEVRRKFRRFEEAGKTVCRVVESREALAPAMATFLSLFTCNRGDKCTFMTTQMAAFFLALAEAMAEQGLLRLHLLDLNGSTVAAALCFELNNKVYLYNNAYDDHFRSYSVGLLSKLVSIRDGIQRQRSVYDFLKGGEVYKHRLGGKPVQLCGCRIGLTQSAWM
jgi:CelD/BcsL family acetyltransferase involved in cellulose biosynthesis